MHHEQKDAVGQAEGLSAGDEEDSARMRRLHVLLEKTSVYTSFLADKMRQHELVHRPRSSPLQSPSKAPSASSERGAVFEQPALITGGTLKPYQLEGVEWLATLYENGLNGILADEMGLGKTVQCIAFIAFLIERGVSGPFLIVAPLSTIANWRAEFERFAPRLQPLLYHGTKQGRMSLGKSLQRTPIVITSYEMVMADARLFRTLSWKFIVVDEGQRLKNLNCKLIRVLKGLASANRLLLTGTPLQNRLEELWSLMNFLLPDIFDDLDSFQQWFDEEELAEGVRPSIIASLHAILRPFLLRRLKSDVESALPPKRELIVECLLTSLQRQYYQAALDGTLRQLVLQKSGQHKKSEAAADRHKKQRLTRNAEDAAPLSDFEGHDLPLDAPTAKAEPLLAGMSSSFQNLLMQLRKACNHPYLFAPPHYSNASRSVDGGNEKERLFRDGLVRSSGKMVVLLQLLERLVSDGHRTLVFSQMTRILDLIEDAIEMDAFGRDDGIQVFLLSTRAGGLGINLTAADTVIFYDSDWNPQADLQAQDRVHRIGQTRPVLVYRLACQRGTVEHLMLDRARMKMLLERRVMARHKFKGRSQILSLPGTRRSEEEGALRDRSIAVPAGSRGEAARSIVEADWRLQSGRHVSPLELSEAELEVLMDRSPQAYSSDVASAAGNERVHVRTDVHLAINDALVALST